MESGCIPALTNKNTHIYCPFHCTGTLSSTYIMYIFRNNLFGFFPKQIPNPNISKYFWNDYLLNQIIPNFLKVSNEQIQITPNTSLKPQIHPNTNFLWLFGTPNVMPWLRLMCPGKLGTGWFLSYQHKKDNYMLGKPSKK